MSPNDDKRVGELLDVAMRRGGGVHRLPDGTTVIVCTRGTRGTRQPRCSGCGAPGADKLCDYPVVRANGKAGTCDRPLCERCAVSVGVGRDYCGPHHRYEQKRAQGVAP
jgi:hypothetical protein